MKISLSLIALSAVAVMAAGPVKVGGDVSGALFLPKMDPSFDGLTMKMGFGGKIAPAVEYAINEQLSVRGSVGFEYLTYGMEIDLGDLGKATTDVTSMLLPIGASVQYAFIPAMFGSVGVGYDINLSSKAKTSFMGVEATEDDASKANPLSITAGLGYKITPEMAVTAGYAFPLTGISDGDGTKITVQTISLGFRYDVGM